MDIQQAILKVLESHKGIKDRIGRGSLLCQVNALAGTQIGDRDLRTAIENLRCYDERGAFICSTTRAGGGYFIATGADELKAYLDQETHRVMHLAQKTRMQRARAGLPLGGQQSLFGELS